MGYRKARIYFTSGTGNSYRVASWLHESCVKRRINSEIIPMDKAAPADEIDSSPETLVVLAYPAHGLMPPWSAIKFIFRMPVKKGAHFFCMPTRGCFHIGPVPIPGAAGLGTILPLLVLPLKGYNVRGAVSFDMPVNMSSIHPRLTDGGISRILGRARRKAERAFTRLFNGRPLWFTWNNLWELLWGAIPLALFPLFPAVYLLMGRFFMGKLMFANTACTGCGLCAKSCPNGAINMKNGRAKRPYWRYNCEDCLRCMAYCPSEAVEAGHSWGVILVLISTVPVSTLLFSLLARHLPDIDRIKNFYTLELVHFMYYYPAIILAYFLFHKLMRFKPVNMLFTYTTLTHYFRRYHEPETTLAMLTEGKRDGHRKKT